MSDLIKINTNDGDIPKINDIGKLGSSVLLDEKSNSLQEMLTTQENFEKLHTDRSPSNTISKVLNSIGKGILSAVGAVAYSTTGILTKVANSIGNSFIGRLFSHSGHRSNAEAFIQGQKANNAVAPKDNTEINQFGKTNNNIFEMLKAHSGFESIHPEVKADAKNEADADFDGIEKADDNELTDTKEIFSKDVAKNEIVGKNENPVDSNIKNITKHNDGDNDVSDLKSLNGGASNEKEVILKKEENNVQSDKNIKNGEGNYQKEENPPKVKTDADKMSDVAERLSKVFNMKGNALLTKLNNAVQESKQALKDLLNNIHDINAHPNPGIVKYDANCFRDVAINFVEIFKDSYTSDGDHSETNPGIHSPLELAEDVYILRGGLNLLIKKLESEAKNTNPGSEERVHAEQLLKDLTDPESIKGLLSMINDEIDYLKQDQESWIAGGQKEIDGNSAFVVKNFFYYSINQLNILKLALETDVDVLKMK